MGETLSILLHLGAALVMGMALLIQVMATGRRISREDLEPLRRLHTITLAALALAVIGGLLLWLGPGRPADFYSSNPLFRIKLTLVAVLAVAAMVSAAFIRRSRTCRETGDSLAVPVAVRWSSRLALLMALIIPVLAWMMARGIGQ